MLAIKKIFKWMIITILSFCTFNLFISEKYKVERSITIDASCNLVYGKVIDLQAWPSWAIWWKEDTNIEINYVGERYDKNFKMSWDGKESGKGTLEIIAVNFPDSINTELIFDGMNPVDGVWRFAEIDGVTKVSWSMKGEMPFFMRFMTLFFDTMLGKDLEEGLQGLKEMCESFSIRSS